MAGKTQGVHRWEIRVQPRSSRTGILGVQEGVLKFGVSAPPEDGKANAELVKRLAKELGCAKGDVSIVSGETSRNKVVEITDASAARRLSALLGKQEEDKRAKDEAEVRGG